MQKKKEYTRSDLSRIAAMVIKEHGLEPDFSGDVHDQLSLLNAPGEDHDPLMQDLTGLL
jgi:exoribonuclease-2